MNYSDLTLEKDTIYLCSLIAMGDTFIFAGLKKKFENALGHKIVFLIRKNYVISLQLYGIKDYIIVDDIDSYNKYSSLFSDFMECGKIYLCHPVFHKKYHELYFSLRDNHTEIPFLPWFLKFLGLPADTPLEPIKYIPPVPTDLLETIGAPIEKIVLFSPEANSVPPVDAQIWEEKAKELQAEGFTVVSNVILKDNAVKGTLFVPMTVEQAVALAFHCHAVYSLRSGFCDLIHPVGNRLTVFYPSYASLWIYSLNKMFGGTQINEELHLPSLKSRNAAQNLPSLKSQNAAQKEKWKIFFFKIIHFRACRKDGALTRVKFLGIPFLSLKQKGNIVRVRLLGIPFMRIKKVR